MRTIELKDQKNFLLVKLYYFDTIAANQLLFTLSRVAAAAAAAANTAFACYRPPYLTKIDVIPQVPNVSS